MSEPTEETLRAMTGALMAVGGITWDHLRLVYLIAIEAHKKEQTAAPTKVTPPQCFAHAWVTCGSPTASPQHCLYCGQERESAEGAHKKEQQAGSAAEPLLREALELVQHYPDFDEPESLFGEVIRLALKGVRHPSLTAVDHLARGEAPPAVGSAAPAPAVETLTDVAELHAQIERLTLRGEAYENAYGIAYRATYQSHTGHWDRTGGSGSGCPECIKAREARENCDAVLREGLQKLSDAAAARAALAEPKKEQSRAIPKMGAGVFSWIPPGRLA